ncbi:phosphonate ABC transporter ATP-binding protein [Desulfosporosinus sp.]|uniref:phosphonate ABC transporter ATP-binding protein n=1 Tax=Desulfosporosinus sp. TaxID=157907 RepID=UPI0025C1FF06|nr:ATP-binding cassette domain-containing protein [Desulfosporosinus sp.]MBC2723956.1 ATP-binding cassette domain-containing protein [Desulfosporosinus sp.]MBC2725313.1 ATP-binding cassette domain-containing protein [Desulfosporosinus sp.]
MDIILAEGLSKVYPNGQGLHNASFSVSKGEIIGIVGPSGAGKSTLLRLLCGAIFPSEGNLTILGQTMSHLNRQQLQTLRGKIATVYQNFNVIPSLDVARNVFMGKAGKMSFASVVRGTFRLTAKEESEIEEILTTLGIEDKLYERCQELSGGQQQRVAVARAIYSGAELILADEPIASVDPATAELILQLFQSLNKQGKTILLSLHQIDSALKYCSKILAFDHGTIAFNGSPEDYCKSDVSKKLMRNFPERGVKVV